MSRGSVSAPVAAADGLVPVSYSSILIQRDWSDGDEADPPAVDPPDGDGVTAGLDGLCIGSAASHHEASVRLERWEGEPPRLPTPGTDWQASWQTVMPVSAAGTFRAWEVTGGPVEDWGLDLPKAGPWAVRVYSAGSAALREAVRFEPHEQVPYPVGVEKYLVQFWPAG